MCRSMVNIQSPAAEIRRGKKKKERKKEETGSNIMVCPITQGDHNEGTHDIVDTWLMRSIKSRSRLADWTWTVCLNTQTHNTTAAQSTINIRQTLIPHQWPMKWAAQAQYLSNGPYISHSKLDYCNSLYHGRPQSQTNQFNRLEWVSE